MSQMGSVILQLATF